MMFVKEWGGCTEKQQDLVKAFYSDLKEYFGDDKRLSEFTEEQIDDFKNWVAKKIAERPKNMTGLIAIILSIKD